MIIVGELINTSRKAISTAVEEKNIAYIQDIAKKQVEAGANYVDVNVGTLVRNEPETLSWLVNVVQEVVDIPLCLDSPNPVALKAALQVHKGQALINSITAENKRYNEILPLVLGYNARVVALCIDDSGMPDTVKDRLKIVDVLSSNLIKAGLQEDDIFFDPLVKPISVNIKHGHEVLTAIKEIHAQYPGVHTICGLSNISFGSPNRKLLNQAFLVMCMAYGMDSAIMDPLDEQIMSLLIAAKTLIGKDDFCMEYLRYQRSMKKK